MRDGVALKEIKKLLLKYSLFKIVSELDQPNALDLIKLQSQSLGASHFRMKVWFQAENWLCVKNCLLETIISGLSVKSE